MKDVIAELFGELPEPKLTALSTPDRALDVLRERNRRIEVRFERLKLLTLGLWEIVKEKTDVSDDDLRRMIAQLDMADGRKDGRLKVSEGMAACDKCGRIVLQSSPICPYCGQSNDTYDPLRSM